MIGRSHGEWYPSADDIASSDDEAEYWAIFGTTQRGNMRCLGEFATRQDAVNALTGGGSSSKYAEIVRWVVRPMKGHSRDAWPLSADDVADSAEQTAYWAILGLTTDGKIYLADDFETKDMAKAALVHFR